VKCLADLSKVLVVFTSPTVNSILAAIRAVTTTAIIGGDCDNSKGGCLLVVKNYTGDRLNFGMACELANAEGRNTAMVVVDDDCALPRKKGVTGSRGVAGTIFVHKVAGAAAARGKELSEVVEVANLAIGRIGSLGVSFESVTLPGADTVNDRLKGELMEIGLGIHGEAGIRQHEFLPVQDIAHVMIQTIHEFGFCTGPTMTNDGVVLDDESALTYLKPNDKIVIMINNLGGTSNFEMSILVQACVKILEAEPYKCPVVAVHAGSYMTSFNMHGASLSILSLDVEGTLEDYLSEKTLAPAWNNTVEYRDVSLSRPSLLEFPEVPPPDTSQVDESAAATIEAPALVISNHNVTVNVPNFNKRVSNAILAACEAIITNESQLTRFDTIVGDGDCGHTFSRGASELKERLQNGILSAGNNNNEDAVVLPSVIFWNIANAISDSMGGSSGVLLELMFRKMSTYLRTIHENCSNDGDNDETLKVITKEHLCQAFIKGTESISFYGGAKVGARTMLDALVPAAVEAATITTSQRDNILKDMANASKKGALSTAFMKEALAGRSNYLSAEQIIGTPDPGAMAVAVILEAIATSF